MVALGLSGEWYFCMGSRKNNVLLKLALKPVLFVLKYGKQCWGKPEAKICSISIILLILATPFRVNAVSAHRYETLLSKGEHETFGKKIRNDAFRTFQQDCVFAQRVPENKLIRVLNAFAHAQGNKFPYVQGLNALCGPLLYVMPELDAFYCFEQLGK